jgi:hypothetical protein
MVKFEVLEDNNNSKYSEAFTGTAFNSSFTCKDYAYRPLKYKNELSKKKFDRQMSKIFNKIDVNNNGFIKVGNANLNLNQFKDFIKKNNLLDSLKKTFQYMSHDLIHVKLYQVKNYLEQEKKIKKKVLDTIIPKSILNDEVTFYKFLSIIISAAFKKYK